MQNPGGSRPQSEVRVEQPMHPGIAERETEGWGAKLKRFASEAVSFTAEKTRHSVLGDISAGIERAGIRFMDRRAVESAEKAYQKVHRWAIGVDTKITARNLNVGKLEDSLKRMDESVARQQGLGRLDSKTAMKAAKERTGIEQRLEKEKAMLDKAQVRLQKLNDIKAGFENKQKAIAEKVIGRVGEKIRPFTQRMEALQPKREQISLEIENFRARKAKFVEQAGALEAELHNSTFGFERDILKKTISEIKAELKKTDSYIESRTNARAKIEKRMSGAETRLEKWRTVSSEFGRVTNRTREYAAPGAREAVTPDFGRRGYSFDAPGAPQHPPAGGGPATPGNEPLPFEDIHFTPEYYTETWNKHFKSEAEITPAALMRYLAGPDDTSAQAIESAVRSYLTEGRTIERTRLSDSDIEGRLASMRKYLLDSI